MFRDTYTTFGDVPVLETEVLKDLAPKDDQSIKGGPPTGSVIPPTTDSHIRYP
jgi:hypothetical protein